jgi:hypothetical protein
MSTPNPGGALGTTQRFAPEVCGVREWTTLIAADPAMDISVIGNLSVAGAPSGATVLAVPRAGGTITGFSIDDRMNVVGDPTGTKVAIDGSFTAVSASLTNGRLVSAAVDSGIVNVNLLGNDLSNAQAIAKLPGNFVGKPAVLYANGDRVIPVATDAGLTVHAFDGSWNWINSKDVQASKPAIGMATTQVGNSAMVAWSTDYDCYVRLINTFDSGNGSTLQGPCLSPRLAANSTQDSAVLVYQTPQGVRFVSISHSAMNPATRMIRANASSPRVLFDGQRYWISYLDARGDVVVGILDSSGNLVSMGLTGTTPKDQAYELTMVNGSPWVLSLDADGGGYTAQRMCVAAVW